MADNRNNPGFQLENSGEQTNKRQDTQADSQNKPDDRLKDGTNDFVNGDQEENSQSSSTSDAASKNG